MEAAPVKVESTTGGGDVQTKCDLRASGGGIKQAVECMELRSECRMKTETLKSLEYIDGI